MLDFRLLIIVLVLGLILTAYSIYNLLDAFSRYRHYDVDKFVGPSFAFAISMTITITCFIHLMELANPDTSLYVKPSITTTSYTVTQVQTDLNAYTKTYELTSTTGDNETLSNSTYKNLSKGDKLLKKQYSTSKISTGLVYQFGNFKQTKWSVINK